MVYSCSLCFSDQFSYRKHFISSYGLENIIQTNFAKEWDKIKEMGGSGVLGCYLQRWAH
jgi:hypothetical protein